MIRILFILLAGVTLALPGLANIEFADLPSGKTAFEFKGDPKGPVVVLIHGVLGPMMVWDALYKPLTNAGFRVLRYDLLGRGQSERVSNTYSNRLFQDQLVELLSFLSVGNESIHFIGSSMGNIIASEYALLHPSQVKSMVIIGPAGFSFDEGPLSKLSTAPVIGDVLAAVVGSSILAKRNREYFFESNNFEVYLKRFENQLRVPGSKQSILSTMRNMPVKAYLDGYRSLGQLQIPTLLVWGRNDISFEFKFSKDLLETIPHAIFLPVERAAHLPQLERPEIVTPAVIEFLSRGLP